MKILINYSSAHYDCVILLYLRFGIIMLMIIEVFSRIRTIHIENVQILTFGCVNFIQKKINYP